MTDSEGWNRVARTVRRRRVELGRTQQDIAEQAGVSLATWRLVETAGRDRYQDLTVRGLTRALGWRPEAIDLLLAGDVADDDLLVAAPSIPTADVPAGLARRWRDLSVEEQSKVEGFIEGLMANRPG